MLADSFRQQIVAAIQDEARRYTSEDIYANREILLRMQAHVGSTLKEHVNHVLGGEFFWGPTFRPESPECPAQAELECAPATPAVWWWWATPPRRSR